jgi:RiboL-PSP-HEPN
MYSDHFKLADDFIVHLDVALGGIGDPFIRSRYVGFVAISAVTVFELALKEIFCTFATTKHRVLGNFVTTYFERLNGQIGRDRIEKMYLPHFGDKYVKRFHKKLEVIELGCLKADRVSVKASYANLLTWRHGFAHEGTVPVNATYEEVKKSYQYGRRVIECLADTMTR